MTALVDAGVFFALYSLRDEHYLDSLALAVHLLENKRGQGYVKKHILDERHASQVQDFGRCREGVHRGFLESEGARVASLGKEAERRPCFSSRNTWRERASATRMPLPLSR